LQFFMSNMNRRIFIGGCSKSKLPITLAMTFGIMASGSVMAVARESTPPKSASVHTRQTAPPPSPSSISAPDISGVWCFRGISGQLCAIAQSGDGKLRLITEKGVPMTGHFQNSTTFLIDDSPEPGFIGMTGTLSPDGATITFSNDEHWKRCPPPTAGPAPTDTPYPVPFPYPIPTHLPLPPAAPGGG
jgi:hypothetical protein